MNYISEQYLEELGFGKMLVGVGKGIVFGLGTIASLYMAIVGFFLILVTI